MPQTNITFTITDGKESIEFAADNTFIIFNHCEQSFKKNILLTLQAVKLNDTVTTVVFPNSWTPIVEAIAPIWADRLNYR